jgi:hypothetical protein
MVSDGLEACIREKLVDWRGLLKRDVTSGREVLRTLLVGPLRFTPVVEPDRRGYQFTGAIALARLIGGVITVENTGWRGVPDGNGGELDPDGGRVRLPASRVGRAIAGRIACSM